MAKPICNQWNFNPTRVFRIHRLPVFSAYYTDDMERLILGNHLIFIG